MSAGTVSNVASTLDADLQAYQSKPLGDDIVFLFLDGISQKVREIGVEGKVMLCTFGIRADGRKELFSFWLTDLENMPTWQGFLVDLKSRGLKGKASKLIIVDGNPAFLRALRKIYPLRRIQRCIAHKLRNVVLKLKRAQREACMGEAKRIFGASSRTEAIRQFKAWRARWIDEAETAVHFLEKDLFHCLHYFRFPEGTMENHSDHQYPRTGLPGSPAKDEAHGRIY
ncbi:MAG: transposase [bacterium]